MNGFWTREKLEAFQEITQEHIIKSTADVRTHKRNRNQNVALGMLFGGLATVGILMHGEAKSAVEGAQDYIGDMPISAMYTTLPAEFIVDDAIVLAGISSAFRFASGALEEWNRRSSARVLAAAQGTNSDISQIFSIIGSNPF